MNFQKLNLEIWERGPVFRHFIDDIRCVMSLTADIDITDFLKVIRQKGYKLPIHDVGD
nr:CatA-like O-acetyltransferase [uncultured Solibaculum sp.]